MGLGDAQDGSEGDIIDGGDPDANQFDTTVGALSDAVLDPQVKNGCYNMCLCGGCGCMFQRNSQTQCAMLRERGGHYK
jgi:hypothetical protein